MEKLQNKRWLGQVHQGDCIHHLQSLPPGSVHLAFADPPFNIGYDYDEYHDRLESDHYLEWSRTWMAEIYRVLDDHGAFWLAIGDEYAAELKVEAQRLGFVTRNWVVWYYTFGVHCTSKFTRSHAHLFYFVKDPKRFTFHSASISVPSARQLVYGDKRANPTGRMPDDTWILRPQDCVEGFTPDEDTWYFPRVAGTFKERAGFHGCQMPEQLLGRIIRACSSEGDVVLDPFAGSCTTLTVAKKLGRNFIGFELSKEYVKLGQKRIQDVSIGDELEGSPEPKASAPSTYAPKARRLGEDSPKTRALLPFMLDGVEEEALTKQVVEAFSKSNRGFSVDRLVADPLLNEDFQQACDRAKIELTPVERNRFLFRLRKSGKLRRMEVETNARTSIDWDQVDPFLFASEIAWKRLTEQYSGVSLDEILCDPRMATAFDKIAQSLAPGYTPLEYRWGALKLRKQSALATKRSEAMKAKSLGLRKFRDEDWGELEHCNVASDSNAIVYAFRDREGRFLYVGETQCWEKRLQLHRIGVLSATETTATIKVAIMEVESLEGSRLSRQLHLYHWYKPQWNFGGLYRTQR